MPLDTVEDALHQLRSGRPVVVVDDEDRENEGDLIQAAEHVTPESVAFFLRHTSGFLCTAITPARQRELALPPMVETNTDHHGTAFLVSVDLREGTTTGISASDRAATVRALADPAVGAADFTRPGHVLPLLAREGGVLTRPGHTEAGVDLCVLAGLTPAALLCELVSEDRLEMMRGADLEVFAREHGLAIISVQALIEYRRARAAITERVSEAILPLDSADFRAVCYRSGPDGVEHLALVLGDVTVGAPVVRVHSECLTGDVFGSRRCDCGAQLQESLSRVAEEGRGIVVYLRGHEGRGIGLAAKVRAYGFQDSLGLDTVDANLHLGLPVDGRDYGVAAEILYDLGVRRLRLVTNNPDKSAGLAAAGLSVVDRIALPSRPGRHNIDYLRTKRDRMGHLLDLPLAVADPW